MFRWTQRLAVLALVGGLTLATLEVRDRSWRLYAQVTTAEDRYYLPPPTWLKLFSLGYNEAAADVLWVTAIVYFGREVSSGIAARARLGDDRAEVDAGRFTLDYVTAVTSLDPRFQAAYRTGGALTLYNGGAVTRRNIEQAIGILEKGLSIFPDDGQLAFSLGFIHYSEMKPYLPKDPNDPERQRHENEGIRLLRRASLMKDTPPYAKVLGVTLMRKGGADELVVAHLESLIATETNPIVRRDLELHLRLAAGTAAEGALDRINAMRRKWERKMPYVPFELFSIIDSEAGAVSSVLNPLHLSDELLSDGAEFVTTEERSGDAT